MIDTVWFELPATPSKLALPKTWDSWPSRVRIPKQGYVKVVKSRHLEKQIQAYCCNGLLTVQASLPRVLHGDNRRLILTQQQLETALCKTLTLLKQKADFAEPEIQFKRVDLVWQIVKDAVPFFRAHQNLLHPEIRKLPWHFPRETLLWKGSEMAIEMYDKILEFLPPRKQPVGYKQTKEHVLRIEARLTKDKLKNELGNGAYPSKLCIEECYECFRTKILAFLPRSVLRIPKRIDIYALAARERWTVDGVLVIDLLLDGLETANSIRRRIAKHQLTENNIFWKRLLPTRLPSKLKTFLDCDVYLPEPIAFAKSRVPRPLQNSQTPRKQSS